MYTELKSYQVIIQLLKEYGIKTLVLSLTCNFTDAWSPSLDSQRVSRLRIDWDRVFLKVPTVMRPCDGTSGLVRGNRRKAVFAFKGLFAVGRLARFSLSCARFYRVFSEVRGKI